MGGGREIGTSYWRLCRPNHSADTDRSQSVLSWRSSSTPRSGDTAPYRYMIEQRPWIAFWCVCMRVFVLCLLVWCFERHNTIQLHINPQIKFLDFWCPPGVTFVLATLDFGLGTGLIATSPTNMGGFRMTRKNFSPTYFIFYFLHYHTLYPNVKYFYCSPRTTCPGISGDRLIQ